jgi:hypothetical protein
MRRTFLFLVSIIVTGACALIGSMIGHFLGSHLGVMLGGVLGGLIGAFFSARIATWRGWIAKVDFYPTTIGAEVGFLAAAFIAAKTLSSPIGPLLSSLLIGIGAVVGSSISARRRSGTPQS